jgi:prepilin-type N-terminal cleavage/methylation domain-containing protein
MRRMSKHPEEGFTLIELAVVIAIIGILLAVVMTPLAARIQIQKFKDQERQLAEIKDALIGFAQTQGRLPCADTDNDGQEDCDAAPGSPGAGVTCAASANVPEVYLGNLPFATLGTGAADLWGRRYVYAVTPAMTVAAQTGQPTGNAGLDLADLGTVDLLEKQTDKTTTLISNSAIGSGAAAIIVSLGANGFGGIYPNDDTIVAPNGADEAENANTWCVLPSNSRTFITRIRTDGPSTCNDTIAASNFCEFDDVVTLIPTPLLLGKMVQAGQLP